MKKGVFIIIVLFISLTTFSQEQIYNPKADAAKNVKEAVQKAKQNDKHVFVMIGGNWCPWCRKLHSLLTTNEELSKVLNKNYVMVKVNYSKENKNQDVLASFAYPQRFGFPVLVILNEKGRRIHTQNTVYLEEGKGYEIERIKTFLKNWSPSALSAELYEE